MTRAERNEYNYIKRSLKNIGENPYGVQLTIRTDAGHEYKQALHEFYTSLGFHPASVRIDTHWFNDKERISPCFSRLSMPIRTFSPPSRA